MVRHFTLTDRTIHPLILFQRIANNVLHSLCVHRYFVLLPPMVCKRRVSFWIIYNIKLYQNVLSKTKDQHYRNEIIEISKLYSAYHQFYHQHIHITAITITHNKEFIWLRYATLKNVVKTSLFCLPGTI